MASPPSIAAKRIESYFDQAPEFAGDICRTLRRIIFKAEPRIVEEWKWGPHYSMNGMVCSIGAFQKHVALAFFRGAHMKDPKRLFVRDNAPAKDMRRIQFVSPDEVHEATLISYLKAAVALNRSGSASSKPVLVVPADLTRILAKNKKLNEHFRSLSYTHQKEYVKWIESAKKEETRAARVVKTVTMLGRKIKHP